jgi:hypothetical protein
VSARCGLVGSPVDVPARRLYQYQRRLGHLGGPERLGHEREPAARGTGHRLRARVGGAEGGDGRGLVFDLLGDAAPVGEVPQSVPTKNTSASDRRFT